MAIFYIHKPVGAICCHVVCHTKCYAQLLDYVVLLKYDNVIILFWVSCLDLMVNTRGSAEPWCLAANVCAGPDVVNSE